MSLTSLKTIDRITQGFPATGAVKNFAKNVCLSNKINTVRYAGIACLSLNK